MKKRLKRRIRYGASANGKEVFTTGDGTEIPTLFDGEMMTCAICGKQQQSDPRQESNWRAIQIDEEIFYICTDHFPPDKMATIQGFTDAYEEVINSLFEKREAK